MLSRLDTAILVITLAVFDVLLSAVAASPSLAQLDHFSMRRVPVAVYLILNELWFHPSCRSPERRNRCAFIIGLLTYVLQRALSLRRSVFSLFILLQSPSRALFCSSRVPLTPSFRGRLPFFWRCCSFHFLFVIAFSMLSDWPIWSWYGYPLIAFGPGAARCFTAGRSALCFPRHYTGSAGRLGRVALARMVPVGRSNGATRRGRTRSGIRSISKPSTSRALHTIPVSMPWATAPAPRAICT